MLKDGQIVEQGNHSELLALNGEFAKMWAAQVQGAEDVPLAGSHQKEAVSGYSVEEPATKEGAEPAATQVEHFVDSPAAVDAELAQAETAEEENAAANAETAEAPSSTAPDEVGAAVPAQSGAEHSQEATTIVDDQAPVAFPAEAAEGARPSGDSAAAVAFPGSGSEAAAPVAFPGGDDAASQKAMTLPEGAQTPQQTPGVTFQDAQSPPRSGATSPDPDGKRRRTLSTQGIQRFARRLSTSKRSDSVSAVPKAGGFMAALRREGTSTSKDDGSSKDAGESPNASVSSDIGQAKKLSKKEKKKDKRKSTPGGV